MINDRLDEYAEHKREVAGEDEKYIERLKEKLGTVYELAKDLKKGSVDKLLGSLNEFERKNRAYQNNKTFILNPGDLVLAETRQGLRPAIVYDIIEQTEE